MGFLNGQNLVLGIVEGGIYGLLAVGIVLVYRGSRVLNFAQGEIGTVALVVAWYLTTDRGYPWIVGAGAGILAAIAIGLAFERLVVRPMADSSRISVAVATVGLLLFLLALGFRVFGESPRTVPAPIAGLGLRVAGVIVSPTQLLSLAVTIAVGAALAVLLRKTDFGLGVLAAADDPTAVRLVGVSLSRVLGIHVGHGGGRQRPRGAVDRTDHRQLRPRIRQRTLRFRARRLRSSAGCRASPAPSPAGSSSGCSRCSCRRPPSPASCPASPPSPCSP